MLEEYPLEKPLTRRLASVPVFFNAFAVAGSETSPATGKRAIKRLLSGGKQQTGTKKQSEWRAVQAGGNRPADTENGLGTASAGHQDGDRTERRKSGTRGGEAAAVKRSMNGSDCWHGEHRLGKRKGAQEKGEPLGVCPRCCGVREMYQENQRLFGKILCG